MDREPELIIETGDYAHDQKLHIRPIAGSRDLFQVYRLTHDAYVSRGYCLPRPNGMLNPAPEFDFIPESSILVAAMGPEVVGSATLTLNGPKGFPLDTDFRREINLIRQEGRNLAAVWRMVINEASSARHQALHQLMAEVSRRLIAAQVQTTVFSVHPSYVRACKHILNMHTVAGRKTTIGLSNVPAVLMRCDSERLPRRGNSRPFAEAV